MFTWKETGEHLHIYMESDRLEHLHFCMERDRKCTCLHGKTGTLNGKRERGTLACLLRKRQEHLHVYMERNSSIFTWKETGTFT